jgi:hypothetical protein
MVGGMGSWPTARAASALLLICPRPKRRRLRLPWQSLSVDAQTYSAHDEKRQDHCKKDGVPIHIVPLSGESLSSSGRSAVAPALPVCYLELIFSILIPEICDRLLSAPLTASTAF